MTLASSQVRVAGTGELSLGPTDADLPTTATAALTGFTGYGYTTEDGVTLSKSVTREGVPAWQSTTPVRYLVTGQEFTVACTFLQSNDQVLRLWLGSEDFATDGGTGFGADVPIDPLSQAFALVLDWKDGDLRSRLVIPKVEITETGDVALARSATQFPVTFGALAPESGDVLASWLTNDTAFGPPTP